MARIIVKTPTLHRDQMKLFETPGRFKAVRCGRRWGKTKYGQAVAEEASIKGESVGWFAPETKFLTEVYSEIMEALEPVKLSASQTKRVIRTTLGGKIDFWSLDDERAGRGRKYHKVIIDEAAFTKDNMMDIWEQSIKPTLLDYTGSAVALSNTRGVDSKNFMWRICNQKQHGFVEFHAPSFRNPHVPEPLPGESVAQWLERRNQVFVKIKQDNPPLVYQQEYLAEFVDWSGAAFFQKDRLLIDDGFGKFFPLEKADRVDVVFAIIDTAVKTGKDNDGTAVTYFGLSKTSAYPLTILDWDITQIEGALLETWLPTVFQNLEFLARETNARMGNVGAHIEDKTSGTILIQQARRRNWPAFEIDSKLTSLGKDERAISVSGYVYQGKVKFTRKAYDKVVVYKGDSRNHLLSQVAAFRVGDKTAKTRADDLLDTFCYGIALGLGDSGGF